MAESEQLPVRPTQGRITTTGKIRDIKNTSNYWRLYFLEPNIYHKECFLVEVQNLTKEGHLQIQTIRKGQLIEFSFEYRRVQRNNIMYKHILVINGTVLHKKSIVDTINKMFKTLSL